MDTGSSSSLKFELSTEGLDLHEGLVLQLGSRSLLSVWFFTEGLNLHKGLSLERGVPQLLWENRPLDKTIDGEL